MHVKIPRVPLVATLTAVVAAAALLVLPNLLRAPADAGIVRMEPTDRAAAAPETTAPAEPR